MCPVVGEHFLQLQPHRTAAALGRHANLLPLVADAGGTNEGDDPNAKHQSEPHASILRRHSATVLCQFILRRH